MDLGSMVPYLKEPIILQIISLLVYRGSMASVDFDWQPPTRLTSTEFPTVIKIYRKER